MRADLLLMCVVETLLFPAIKSDEIFLRLVFRNLKGGDGELDPAHF